MKPDGDRHEYTPAELKLLISLAHKFPFLYTFLFCVCYSEVKLLFKVGRHKEGECLKRIGLLLKLLPFPFNGIVMAVAAFLRY